MHTCMHTCAHTMRETGPNEESQGKRCEHDAALPYPINTIQPPRNILLATHRPRGDDANVNAYPGESTHSSTALESIGAAWLSNRHAAQRPGSTRSVCGAFTCARHGPFIPERLYRSGTRPHTSLWGGALHGACPDFISRRAHRRGVRKAAGHCIAHTQRTAGSISAAHLGVGRPRLSWAC